MANLSRTAVTILGSRYEGTKKELIVRECTIVLTGQGTATNKILASDLGFKGFKGSSIFTKSDNTEVLIGVPSYDKTFLLLKAAATNAPADFTGTYRAELSCS